MPDLKPARGRPKGTGLDDRHLLKNLIELLNADPDLKPTTAIKSLGVTDPSAIRRLRDKYKASQTEMASTFAAKSAVQPAAAVAARRAMPLRSSHQARRSAPAAPAAGLQAAPSGSTPPPLTKDVTRSSAQRDAARDAAMDWFSIWADLGMQPMLASIKVQWILYGHVFNLPHVRAAMTSQTAFTDFAAAWCAFSPDPGKTIH